MENLTRSVPDAFKLCNRGPVPVAQENVLSAMAADPKSFLVHKDIGKHMQNQKKKDLGRVRSRVFCASPDMIGDLKRICIGDGPFKRPINIDTTFKMGTFFLTMAVTRDPIFVDPMTKIERPVVVAL